VRPFKLYEPATIFWQRRGSVGKVIKRLQNLGLTPDAVARCCFFGKGT